MFRSLINPSWEVNICILYILHLHVYIAFCLQTDTLCVCINVWCSVQVRHGAATALREVIKYHGDTAGLTVHIHPDLVSARGSGQIT